MIGDPGCSLPLSDAGTLASRDSHNVAIGTAGASVAPEPRACIGEKTSNMPAIGNSDMALCLCLRSSSWFSSYAPQTCALLPRSFLDAPSILNEKRKPVTGNAAVAVSSCKEEGGFACIDSCFALGPCEAKQARNGSCAAFSSSQRW